MSRQQRNRVVWRNETKICILGSHGIKYQRKRIQQELHYDCVSHTMKQTVIVMI